MMSLCQEVNLDCPRDMHTGDASRLLNQLRENYQALTLKEREQVMAFISELSHTAICVGEQYNGRQI